jgi:hypothetical protein
VCGSELRRGCVACVPRCALLTALCHRAWTVRAADKSLSFQGGLPKICNGKTVSVLQSNTMFTHGVALSPVVVQARILRRSEAFIYM